jgi:hypothetical protein
LIVKQNNNTSVNPAPNSKMLATKYFSLNQLHVSSNPSAQKRSQSVAQSTSRRGGGLTWLDCTGDAKSDGRLSNGWPIDLEMHGVASFPAPAGLPHAAPNPWVDWWIMEATNTPLSRQLGIGMFLSMQIRRFPRTYPGTDGKYKYRINTKRIYFILSCSPARQSRVIQGDIYRYFLES